MCCCVVFGSGGVNVQPEAGGFQALQDRGLDRDELFAATFGQALVEMAAMGDVEWAESCRTAYRKYVTVTRQGPAADDRRIPEHKPSELRPNMTEYWQQRGEKQLGIGHVFKYPYSYYDLMRRVEDAALKTEWEEKAFRLF